jgi:hypothetical protein
MKPKYPAHLLSVGLILVAVSAVSCAKEEKIAATPPSAVTPPAPTPASSPVTVDDEVAFGRWSDIKDATYDNRAQFFDGLTRLEATADREIGELKAKRAAMASTTDTKEWDFAMKEMNDARAYLKDMGDELRKATPDTWNQEKERVGQAWVRTQNAYDKVKHSTTT